MGEEERGGAINFEEYDTVGYVLFGHLCTQDQ